MSDDRTHDPSAARLREARERGMVPSSAELTAAVGVLAAVAALGGWGEALVEGMVGLVRETLAADNLVVADSRSFLTLVREAIGAVAVPLTGILVTPALASLAAHQIQVGGLFVPTLALPDPARLRSNAAGGSPIDRLGRAAGAMLRGALLATLAWWTIRTLIRDIDASPAADAATLLRDSGSALHAAMVRLGLALLAIGLVHYAMQARRISARLRMTSDEHREDARSQGGDPSLRSRRRAARDQRVNPMVVDAAPGAGRIN